jgi:2-dehydropantoate 2-reductase
MVKRRSNIAVMGAGAIGCYFGGMLARAGNTVTLIGRKRHVDAINRNGLLFQSHGHQERIPMAASENAAAACEAQLVLFCVKSLDTDDAALALAPHLPAEAVVLSLQNGVDNVERIRRHVKNSAIPVLVYVAAQMPAPGFVEHTGGGNVVIGHSASSGSDQELSADIAGLFEAAGVPVKISQDIEVELWTKLVMNCAYNAISALGNASYGQMVAMPEVRAVMGDAVMEVARVAAAKGVRLPVDIVETAFKLADAMPVTLSSTAQDIQRGRPTEINHLNGFVVREGAALGIPTPINEMLNALIKLLERTRLGPAS